jgi:hypothetical protein
MHIIVSKLIPITNLGSVVKLVSYILDLHSHVFVYLTFLSQIVKRLKSPLLAAELFDRSPTLDRSSHLSPGLGSAAPPPPPLHRYPSNAERIQRLEREPGVFRVELNRVLAYYSEHIFNQIYSISFRYMAPRVNQKDLD